MTFAQRLAPLVVLFAALALPAVAGAQVQKIGSVNVTKVFSDIKETKDLEAMLTTRGTALNTLNTTLQQKIGALKQSRDQFKPGTDTYDRANAELKKAANQGQFDLQVAQQDLLNEQKHQTKLIYDKIVVAVGDVAKEKGYSMVVAQVSPPEFSDDQIDQFKIDQLIAQLRQQNLMYVDKSADLTADVITRMDASFASSGSANPAPAPAAAAPGAGPTPAPATPAPAPAPAR